VLKKKKRQLREEVDEKRGASEKEWLREEMAQ
jgi:hypothetical protein